MDKRKIKDLCKSISSNLQINKLEDNFGDYPLYGASGFVKGLDFYKIEKPYVSIVKDGAGVGRISFHEAKSSIVGTMQAFINNDDVDLKFLYYTLKSQHLGTSKNGSTIPHIYFKNYGENEINFYSLEKQREIASFLDSISSSIENKKNQATLLDELIKSRFIEMFGDVLKNDKNFETCPFGNYVNQMNIGPFGSDLKNDCFVPKELGYCMVYEQKHAIDKDMSVKSRYVNEEKYNHLKRFDIGPGDIIVSCRGTIGECFMLPKDAPHGIIHPSLMMLKPKDDVNHRFLVFLLEHILAEQNQQGSGVKMAIKATELAKIKTIKPSIEIQNKFINFVEQVDKSKFVVQQQIKDLQELLDKKMDEYFSE